MKEEDSNLIEVWYSYGVNGVLESTEYKVNGELVDVNHSLQSLLYYQEVVMKLKNIKVIKKCKICI
jgi:hypothetical protein